MSDLILLRHGESQSNFENRFPGWVNVPLSARGEREARTAGERLRGRRIDKVHTSVLIRATETARIALDVAGIGPLPIVRDPALNERVRRAPGTREGRGEATVRRGAGEALAIEQRHAAARR